MPPIVIERPDPTGDPISKPPTLGNQCEALERIFKNGANYRGF
jgi:hypothetical protein